MKKVIIGVLLAGIVLIGAGVFLVFSNLDAIVERVIETAGSDAIGTEVSVDSVALELSAGRASIYGFSVANPDGFSDDDMISFDELSVTLDLNDISAQHVGIVSVVALNPRVVYEMREGSSNLDVVNERLGSSPRATEDSGEASQIELSIGSVRIDDIEAGLYSDRLPQPVNVNLGNIALSNMEGTPEQIAAQITRPLIRQLSANAAQAMIQAGAGRIREQADQAREQLEDDLKEKVDEKIGEDLRKGIGDLFNRD